MKVLLLLSALLAIIVVAVGGMSVGHNAGFQGPEAPVGCNGRGPPPPPNPPTNSTG